MPAPYFAPTFRVEINGRVLAADISRNITDVSVTHELDTTDHFSLTVANPYPELRWTHTADADLFREGNGVMIEMGYVNQTRPMLDGEITRISPTFPEGGTPTLRVEGHTRMHRLQGSRKTRTFKDMTDAQIAGQIARELGLQTQIEDTGTKHAYLAQVNQTDLEFLLGRAEQIHFEVLVEGKTLIFRRARLGQSASYTLVWGNPSKSFGVGSTVMPLRSFEPTLNTLQQVSGVTVRGYDPKTKKEIVGRAGTGSEESKMGNSAGGETASQAFDGRQIEEVSVDVPVASQQEADQLAQAIYNRKAMELVTGTGATIGLPDLRPGRTVELEGLGPRFSGRYYVTQTTHSVGGSGYLTTFSAKRNAIS